MKNISLLVSIIALLTSIFCFFYFNSDSELVYVDINKLVDGYDRTAVEKIKFEEKAAKLQANVDSLISDWQKELQLYEKERSSMSKKELDLNQELLASKQQKVNTYRQAIQKQINEEDQKATQLVIKDINDYVKRFGKERGYKLILGASGSGNIMYANEATDLTEEVLNGLNKSFKGS